MFYKLKWRDIFVNLYFKRVEIRKHKKALKIKFAYNIFMKINCSLFTALREI